MPTAEIITIGTEILLGEIFDTNSRHIARCFREVGIDIFRTTSIGDNPQRIADAIKEAVNRADIVITTGGLGPTVDDPTRDAVALAFGVTTVFQEDLWEQVVERFSRFGHYPSSNNRKQAFLPENAIPLENPVGTAPAFMVETPSGVVISLPGVPGEMQYLLEDKVLPYLLKRFTPDSILKIRILHTVGIGESQIDEKISDLETRTNPTVGLAAHAGQVDVRITAKARTTQEAEDAIEEVEIELRRRLGSWVYGADKETLPYVAMRNLTTRGWSLVILEAGLSGELVSCFRGEPDTYFHASVEPDPPDDPDEILPRVADLRNTWGADVGLGIGLYDQNPQPFLVLAMISPENEKSRRIPYGGIPKLAPLRAANYGLNWLRKLE